MKDFIELKKALKDAKSEEETLAILDAFPRRLTDDELAEVCGGEVIQVDEGGHTLGNIVTDSGPDYK